MVTDSRLADEGAPNDLRDTEQVGLEHALALAELVDHHFDLQRHLVVCSSGDTRA